MIKGYDDYDKVLREVLGDSQPQFNDLISEITGKNTNAHQGLSPNKGGIFRALEVDVGSVDAGSIKELEEDFNFPDNLSASNLGNLREDVSEKSKLPNHKNVDQDRIDQYCRPQYLNVCDKDDLGFAYNLVGLFGNPDNETTTPYAYTCLVSLCPPAEPYKPKGNNSMMGAFLFNEIDWQQTTPHHFIFSHTEDVQVSGKLFKPTLSTSLLFDFKRLDLKTG